MFDHRVVRNAVGRRDVAPSGQPHAAAPRTDSNHPGAARPVAVVFEFLDQWLGIGVAPQRDHGLHGIRMYMAVVIWVREWHQECPAGAGTSRGPRRTYRAKPREIRGSWSATPQVAVSRTAGRWSGRQRHRHGRHLHARCTRRLPRAPLRRSRASRLPARPVRSCLGPAVQLRQVAPPHLDQRAVTGYRHHVDFGATLDTSQPDGLHDGAGLVQFPGPGQQ